MLHIWSFLSICGAALGDRYSIPFGDSQINPNMYVIIVGEPASRKSTAIKAGKKLLIEAGYEDIADASNSLQGWLKSIAVPDVDCIDGSAGHIESFIAHDEIINFLGQGNTDFITRLGEIWDKTDGFKHRTAGGTSVAIQELIVNMLGGTTPEQFHMMFPPMVAGQGLLSRLLLVSAPSKVRKLHRPEPMNPEGRMEIVQLLERLRGSSSSYDIPKGSPVDQALKDIYEAYNAHEDKRFSTYDGRRFTHFLKLLIICTALRDGDFITLDDVYDAHTLLVNLEQSMPEAMGFYGRAASSAVSARILNMLKAGPMTFEQILSAVHMDIEKFEDLSEVLMILKQANRIKTLGKLYAYCPPKSSADKLPYVAMERMAWLSELTHGHKDAADNSVNTGGLARPSLDAQQIGELPGATEVDSTDE